MIVAAAGITKTTRNYAGQPVTEDQNRSRDIVTSTCNVLLEHNSRLFLDRVNDKFVREIFVRSILRWSRFRLFSPLANNTDGVAASKGTNILPAARHFRSLCLWNNSLFGELR